MRSQDSEATTILSKSKHLARVWRATVRTGFVREMEFRANFISGIFRQVLWLITFVFLIEVIFKNTNALAGWSKPEVLIVLALSRFIEGSIDAIFSRNIARFPEKVRTGQFDFYLLRPVPAQFGVAFERFNLLNLGNIIAGCILLGYALTSGAQAPSLPGWMLFIAITILGVTIYYCLLMLAATLVFFFERLESLVAISHLFSEPLTVPFDVFPHDIRILLTYLLPLAFVVFVPAQTLTGRIQWWQVGVALTLAGVLLVATNTAWRAGVRRYSSASS